MNTITLDSSAAIAVPQEGPRSSFRRVLAFWWMLLLVMQTAERLFLIPDAFAVERADIALLASTLLSGLRADIIVATLAVGVAMLLAALLLGVQRGVMAWRGRHAPSGLYRRALMQAGIVVGGLFLIVLTVDMGYYGYSRQHMDFVFFEYLSEIASSPEVPAGRRDSNPALVQAGAELADPVKWGTRVVLFFLLQGAMAWLWIRIFYRSVEPALGRVKAILPGRPNVVLAMAFIAGLSGFDLYGPLAMQRVGISSSVYYTLAQNPVWYAGEVGVDAVASHVTGRAMGLLNLMDLDEAVGVARGVLGSDAHFPSMKYPFIRTNPQGGAGATASSPNVLLIFVEGLDRRYLGRSITIGDPADNTVHFIYRDPSEPRPLAGTSRPTVRVTPFLDRLKEDGLYFDRFFSNGVQTSRGLYASLCSFYPRHGAAVMRTRYTHDHLCLPSLLRTAGYQTEMVIAQNRDRNYDHIALFLARNGLDRFFDEGDFDPATPRLAIGMADGDLYRFNRSRIEELRRANRPFFLATMTATTHHPYSVPADDPEVAALQWHGDRYVAALRYADLELERFLTGLRRDGLLRNTIVLILGDHGRHEGIGRSEAERWGGHFLAPLFIWMDEELREQWGYRPRTVPTVASQLDLAPTILALTGLTPRVAPFVGRDLSCLLATDCQADNVAFLDSVYDDVIGLADREGLTLYSLRTNVLYHGDLAFDRPVQRAITAPEVASRYRRMLAIHVSSNLVIDQNRIWSWKEWSDRL